MLDLPKVSQTSLVYNGIQMNIDQAIMIKSLKQTFFVFSAIKGDSHSKRKDLQEWFA